VPIHLGLVLQCTAFNTRVCSASGLQHPAVRRLTHSTFRLLGAVGRELPPFIPNSLLPLKLADQPPGGPSECAVVLSYIQLLLGFAIPTIIQAGLESRLYLQHRRQRLRSGLPLEAGWQARLYSLLADVFVNENLVVTLLFLWVLLGAAWEAALLLS